MIAVPCGEAIKEYKYKYIKHLLKCFIVHNIGCSPKKATISKLYLGGYSIPLCSLTYRHSEKFKCK